MKSSNSFIRDGRASSAVEFAVITPILIIILLSIVRIAYSIGVQYSLTKLSEETVRQVLRYETASGRKTSAEDYLRQHVSDFLFLHGKGVSMAVEESGGTMTVAASLDMSGVPGIPLLPSELIFPKIQTASATLGLSH